jgi:hypothetical protein
MPNGRVPAGGRCGLAAADRASSVGPAGLGVAFPNRSGILRALRSRAAATVQASHPLGARQLIRLVHRWQPDGQLVTVGDRAYAALELLAAVRLVAPVASVVAR